MSLPRFVQIAVSAAEYEKYIIALDEHGSVWRYALWSRNGQESTWCWNKLDGELPPLP